MCRFGISQFTLCSTFLLVPITLWRCFWLVITSNLSHSHYHVCTLASIWLFSMLNTSFSIMSLPASWQCQHHTIVITTSITSVPASHHCQHHAVVNIKPLHASCHCQHHIIVSITPLPVSHYCQNHILPVSCHCQYHIIVIITSFPASCHC